MYKIKDFQNRNVITKEGKKIGFVKDILINYSQCKVIGFKVATMSLFSKDVIIREEDVLSINSNIIVNSKAEGKHLGFKEIKSIEVIDKNGCIIGALEDIIMDMSDFSIRALIISSGLINKMISGKIILLPKDTILGDRNIVYLGNTNIVLRSLPHNIGIESCSI